MARLSFRRDPATLTPAFVTLRLDGSGLPNLGLCFETPWECTAAACLIAASHANGANTPKLQNWLQS